MLKHTEVPDLLMIASGPVPDNPAELLGSDAMDKTLTELRGQFDFVLLDTPPALAVSDAVTLTPRCDGVLVVADASKTKRAAVAHLRHQLERVGGRIVGGILNNLDREARQALPRVQPLVLREQLPLPRGAAAAREDREGPARPTQHGRPGGAGAAADAPDAGSRPRHLALAPPGA